MRAKILRDESGQVMVFTVLCMTCLLGLVAFATDVGLLLRAKRVSQIAADSAAIAGAAELNFGDVTTAARADAAQNGVTNGVGGATVAVNNPPSSGPHSGGVNTGYVEVIVSQSQPTFFMKLFHFSSMAVNARAVATTVPGSGCLYTLGTTGTDIGMTGSGSLTMPNCGILDDSSSGSALNLVGSGTITAKSIGIVGNYNEVGSGSISPTPTTGMSSFADPLASTATPSFTAGSCLANPNIVGSSPVTLGPSVAGGTVCYNGLSIVGSGTITFNPGLYIINGSFSSTGSATLNGTGGVTFYLPSNGDSLSITGSGSVNLTAPTSGPYSGLLFYQNAADTSAASFTGSSSSTLNGIFYLPSAQLTMTGSGGGTFNADVVVQSLQITGSLPLSNYVPLSGSSPLSNPRLVE
jgi:Flp pilus assembly protein TadG